MINYDQYRSRSTYTFQSGDTFSSCCGAHYSGSVAQGQTMGRVRKGIMLLEGTQVIKDTEHWHTYHVETKNGPITLRLKDA